MRTRRGSDFWPGEMGGMVSLYRPGDIVQSVMTGKALLTGVVRDVDSRLNKIWVAWGGGSVVQHDPDEIQLVPAVDDTVRARLNGLSMTASRRGKMSADEQFVGDPDTHGINEPRGGGFSIMQDLQGDLAKEMKKESEAGPRVAKSEVDQHGIHKSWYKSIDDTEITVRQLREDIDDADNMSPKQRKILLDYLKEKRGKNASSDTVASVYELRSRRTSFFVNRGEVVADLSPELHSRRANFADSMVEQAKEVLGADNEVELNTDDPSVQEFVSDLKDASVKQALKRHGIVFTDKGGNPTLSRKVPLSGSTSRNS